MPGGRPPKYTPELLAQLVESFESYIDDTEIPILKEWCVANKVPANHIYDYPEFGESIKRCVDKKEVALERSALEGRVNVSMAIFSLKQLGWRDKQEFDHSGELRVTVEYV